LKIFDVCIETKIVVVGLIVLGSLMSGCAGVLVGSVATGAVIADGERTTGTFVEDQAIELKTLEAIRGNLELRGQRHISVTSYNQIVLLTGQVPSTELREIAVSIASKIEKVRQIFNEIEIAAPSSMVTRSGDSLLTAKVKTKLFTLSGFDATKVKVVSENGVVFLMGILTAEGANIAAVAASQVGGAQKIVKLFEYRN
jgi:osmotically-inducible protein OsmY